MLSLKWHASTALTGGRTRAIFEVDFLGGNSLTKQEFEGEKKPTIIFHGAPI